MKKLINMIVLFVFLLSISIAFNGCAGSGIKGEGEKAGEIKRYEAEFLTLFDTLTKIVGYAESKEEFKKQVEFVHGEMEVYHQLFDIYNEYDGVNNVKTINENAGKSPVVVDEKLIDFLEYSKEIYKLTDGKVNIAFGSVLSIWHDYRESGVDNPENAKLPPHEILKEASIHADINKLIINRENSTVYLSDSKMRLDVGAIAKGYAVEKACNAAEEHAGVTSMLVSAGGNVKAIGYKDENGTKWNVGIQNPDPEVTDKIWETVNVSELSLVTSGDYQRYYTVDGKIYHHIIDPKTLMPANYFKAVTIVCKDSGLADGLSTGAYLLPIEESKAFVESVEGAEALYILNDGTVQVTSGFEEMTSK